jgi:tripartite-type tricarboxylate transporter receptor subunit TctC
MSIRGLVAAATFAAAIPLDVASANEWPTGTVTLTQTFAPGGTMDFITRAVAQAMTEHFNRPFVVETKAGGSGIVGLIAAAHAPADGSNFVVTAIGPMVFRPMLDKNIGFDADHDFEPVIIVAATPNVALAAPKLGVSNIAELKAWVADHGNKMNVGIPGVGTMGQYCGVLLLEKLGIDGNLINYRGATPLVHDLAGSQIELGMPAFGPSVQAAKMLAVAADQRLEAAPGVATLKESGINVTCATWNAIFAPRGTPKAIVATLNAAIDAYLQKPATRKTFSDAGVTPWGGPPERLTRQMVEDRNTWSGIVQRLDSATSK